MVVLDYFQKTEYDEGDTRWQDKEAGAACCLVVPPSIVLQSSFNRPDGFLNRFAENSPSSTQPQPPTQQHSRIGLPKSGNPQQWPEQQPGQPLARTEPQPLQLTPVAEKSEDAEHIEPPLVSLQPDQFGQHWKQDLGSQATKKAAPSRYTPTTTVQGNSRSTWQSLPYATTRVELGSQEGRPVSANVQVWSGPNNVPSKMRLYTENGSMRPWNAAFATRTTNSGAPALDVRNTGPLEYPMNVRISGQKFHDGTTNNNSNHLSQTMTQPSGQPPPPGLQRSSSTDKFDSPIPSQSETVLGGSLGYFSFGSETQRVRVHISSEGLPIYANVELWQGPGNIKQLANIYTDHGYHRPWSAIIETPGYQCTLAIHNVGPMEYPLNAHVETII